MNEHKQELKGLNNEIFRLQVQIEWRELELERILKEKQVLIEKIKWGELNNMRVIEENK